MRCHCRRPNDDDDKNGKGQVLVFLRGGGNQPVHFGSRSRQADRKVGKIVLFHLGLKWSWLALKSYDFAVHPCYNELAALQLLDKILTYVTQYGEITQSVWICHFEQGLPFCFAFKKENFLLKAQKNILRTMLLISEHYQHLVAGYHHWSVHKIKMHCWH